MLFLSKPMEIDDNSDGNAIESDGMQLLTPAMVHRWCHELHSTRTNNISICIVINSDWLTRPFD